ncbi:MAG: Multi-sensor signal transduction histidine kinase [uncultured bacterium]|nr:MAG: Multi-sensor signal transduction histidine kinase [uncultured bacterium]
MKVLLKKTKKIYKILFPVCCENNLRLRECPNFIFTIIGTITIGVMLLTYYITKIYTSIEIVVESMLAIATTMIILAYFVSNGIKNLGEAKRAAELEKLKTESIITHLADGLVMLGKDCKVMLVNPMAEKLLGVSEKNVLGIDPRKKAEKQNLNSFHKALHWCLSEKEMENGKTIKEEIKLDYPIKRILDVRTSPVRDTTGKLLGFVKTLHNVTREKELDDIKSDFISIASHQLKTPLAIMNWDLELLLKNRGKKQKLLNDITASNKEMIQIVSDLLDVSRIEQGRAKLKIRPASMKMVVENAVKKLLQFADKKNIKLTTDLPSKDMTQMIDPEAIELVLHNLLDNALKYTQGHGMVKVTLKYTPKERPKYIEVTVEDNGIGIPKLDQKKLFTKFYRGKNIKEMNVKGTGLGLFIVKNIVDLHQGSITIQSEERKGSKFNVKIPLKTH